MNRSYLRNLSLRCRSKPQTMLLLAIFLVKNYQTILNCVHACKQMPKKLTTDNRPFPSCFEPHYESEVKCKVFVMKISFHSSVNKTNFHMKSFALSLAFIVRFTATRKWPIERNTCFLYFQQSTCWAIWLQSANITCQ